MANTRILTRARVLSALLGLALTAAVQANPETRILIRADRNVRYEYLRSVMAVAGKAGVGKVTFSVVDKDDGAAPAPAA